MGLPGLCRHHAYRERGPSTAALQEGAKMDMMSTVEHAEREWDFGRLAAFIPHNDGLDVDRALGAYFERFERDFEPVDEGDDE